MGPSMKASCRKPGTEFASLLTSGLLIFIPCGCTSGMSSCGIRFPAFSGELDIVCSAVEPMPNPRPRLGPFSSDVAFPFLAPCQGPRAFQFCVTSDRPLTTSGSSCGEEDGNAASSRQDCLQQIP